MIINSKRTRNILIALIYIGVLWSCIPYSWVPFMNNYQFNKKGELLFMYTEEEVNIPTIKEIGITIPTKGYAKECLVKYSTQSNYKKKSDCTPRKDPMSNIYFRLKVFHGETTLGSKAITIKPNQWLVSSTRKVSEAWINTMIHVNYNFLTKQFSDPKVVSLESGESKPLLTFLIDAYCI